MLPKSLFLRWALFTSVITIATIITICLGGFGYVYAYDMTKLSFLIMAIFAAMTVRCGILTWKAGKIIEELKTEPDCKCRQKLLYDIENKAEHGWFSTHICEKIGLMGTIIGFILALSGFLGFQSADPQAVQKLIGQLSIGMSTAFITTLVGIICNILLSIQHQNLGSAIDGVKK